MRPQHFSGLLLATLVLWSSGLAGAFGAAVGVSLRNPDNRLPEEFWTLPAKEAAMALLVKQQPPAWQQEFLLRWEPSAPPPPVGRLTLSLTVAFPRSNPPLSLAYYVHSEKQTAYAVAAGLTFSGFAKVELVPAEARHLVEVGYWLDKIRSQPRASRARSVPYSGHVLFPHEPVELVLRGPEGGILIDLFGTSREPPRLLADDYTASAAAGAAAWLIRNVLDPALAKSPRNHSDTPPQNLLAQATPDERNISMPLVAWACAALDREAILANQPLLEKIAHFAPSDAPALPSYQELHQALNAIPHGGDPRQQEANTIRRAELARLLVNETSVGSSRDPRFLARSAAFALDRAKAENDPALLQKWAASGRHGDGWAFRRLREIAPDLAAQQLETQLASASPQGSEYLFEEILRLSPERARAMLEEPGMPVAVRLESARRMPAGPARDDALIRLLPDYDCTAKQARTIVEELVPLETPDHCTHPRLNATLLKVVTPDRSRRNPDLVSWAANASALRGQTAVESEIARILRSRSSKNTAGLLNAWALLALSQPEARSRLRDFLRTELQTTALSVNTLLWTAWVADLTELTPEIERLAAFGGGEAILETRPQQNPEPVTGPFYYAREILSTWNETDPATKFRKLARLASSEFVPSVNYQHSATLPRARAEFERLAWKVPADQQNSLKTQIQQLQSPLNPSTRPIIEAALKSLTPR
jgi:hypothetical protein